MVAAGPDRWQARAVRIRRLAALLLALAASRSAVVPPAAAAPRLAQAPAITADAPRVMAFTWTLYPGMWAELDLRLAAGAEAQAEITVEGGEVSWNLHTHPPDTPPTAFVTLERGTAARATVRCAPESAGWYSYLFTNDAAGSIRLHVALRLTGDGRLDAVKP
jgi:hypothetical protein